MAAVRASIAAHVAMLLRGLAIRALCALLLVAGPAAAQPSETAVKAAFLPKFAGYVDWPPSLRIEPGAPLVLCIVGADPFGRMIDDAVRGQQVDRHPIALKRLTDAGGATACQLAFVQGNSGHSTADLLAALEGKPVLTITDGRAGPQRGIVHFVVDDGRVRFHIDQAEANRAGLVLNARLLAVALSVRTAR